MKDVRGLMLSESIGHPTPYFLLLIKSQFKNIRCGGIAIGIFT